MSPIWVVIMIGLIFIWLIGLTLLVISFIKRVKIAPLSPSGTSGLSHWSLIKFNPFADTGGINSFVICLLDNIKNGIILTGLHGRGQTRFYAKLISGGQADQSLSNEEKQALNQALKK